MYLLQETQKEILASSEEEAEMDLTEDEKEEIEA